jgi:hypothetical protein
MFRRGRFWVSRARTSTGSVLESLPDSHHSGAYHHEESTTSVRPAGDRHHRAFDGPRGSHRLRRFADRWCQGQQRGHRAVRFDGHRCGAGRAAGAQHRATPPHHRQRAAAAPPDRHHRRATGPIFLGTSMVVGWFTDDRATTPLLRSGVLRVAERLPPVKARIARLLARTDPTATRQMQVQGAPAAQPSPISATGA